jgi:hypothetical protein
MKNLQNFGIQELSLQEQKELDGGVYFLIIGCLGLVGLLVMSVILVHNVFFHCEKNNLSSKFKTI